MKPIYYKKIIIGLQWLIFFVYVGFLFIECYKTNNEVVFVNIPIKYNNEQCPTQDVGIRFTKGGKITPASMQFSSDKFPDKEFEVNNFDGVLFLKSIYWNKKVVQCNDIYPFFVLIRNMEFLVHYLVSVFVLYSNLKM